MGRSGKAETNTEGPSETRMTRRELVVKIKALLVESELPVEKQIEALQEVRGSLKRPPSAHYRVWAGPLTKPGDKKKAKERE